MTRFTRLCAFVLWTSALEAQRAPIAFSIAVENDAFANSDTGYTNGLRLAWSIPHFSPRLHQLSRVNPAVLADLALRGVSLGRARLGALGFVPDQYERQPCPLNPERGNRAAGACTLLNVGLAQVMYTPDTLASTTVIPRDRPYGGFLFATVGITTMDSPAARNPRHWIGYSEASHQFLVGVTGAPALAEQTQSLAHWSWSAGSHRPLGWGTQLRFAPQVGWISDLQVRPRHFEYCRRGCLGIIDERRVVDLTPQTELVASTHMVRVSQGATLRLGMDFPDASGGLRIPVTAPPSASRREPGLVIHGERFWWFVFGNAVARYVPYNMFIAGGWRDGGPAGWRTVRRITPRHAVHEFAGGGAIGSSRMSLRAQFAWRTPEYDVDGFPRVHGLHQYASLALSINSFARSP